MSIMYGGLWVLRQKKNGKDGSWEGESGDLTEQVLVPQ
jgi:hypothetical protein